MVSTYYSNRLACRVVTQAKNNFSTKTRSGSVNDMSPSIPNMIQDRNLSDTETQKIESVIRSYCFLYDPVGRPIHNMKIDSLIKTFIDAVRRFANDGQLEGYEAVTLRNLLGIIAYNAISSPIMAANQLNQMVSLFNLFPKGANNQMDQR